MKNVKVSSILVGALLVGGTAIVATRLERKKARRAIRRIVDNMAESLGTLTILRSESSAGGKGSEGDSPLTEDEEDEDDDADWDNNRDGDWDDDDEDDDDDWDNNRDGDWDDDDFVDGAKDCSKIRKKHRDCACHAKGECGEVCEKGCELEPFDLEKIIRFVEKHTGKKQVCIATNSLTCTACWIDGIPTKNDMVHRGSLNICDSTPVLVDAFKKGAELPYGYTTEAFDGTILDCISRVRHINLWTPAFRYTDEGRPYLPVSAETITSLAFSNMDENWVTPANVDEITSMCIKYSV